MIIRSHLCFLRLRFGCGPVIGRLRKVWGCGGEGGLSIGRTAVGGVAAARLRR